MCPQPPIIATLILSLSLNLFGFVFRFEGWLFYCSNNQKSSSFPNPIANKWYSQKSDFTTMPSYYSCGIFKNIYIIENRLQFHLETPSKVQCRDNCIWPQLMKWWPSLDSTAPSQGEGRHLLCCLPGMVGQQGMLLSFFACEEYVQNVLRTQRLVG